MLFHGLLQASDPLVSVFLSACTNLVHLVITHHNCTSLVSLAPLHHLVPMACSAENLHLPLSLAFTIKSPHRHILKRYDACGNKAIKRKKIKD